MVIRFFILFTLVPICELYLLIRIGGEIGAFNTVLIIIVTASLGAYLARTQGFYVLRRISDSFSRGEMPSYDLLQGLLILLGAFALLTPGFLTDLLGLSMLVPLSRRYYIILLSRYLNKLSKDKKNNFQFRIYRDL